MKMIWIEDFDKGFQSPQLAKSMFGELVPPEILRKEYNRDLLIWNELPRIFGQHTLHRLHICRSYTDWKALFEDEKWDFDIALIDINLEGSKTASADLPKDIDNPEFDRRAGFYIYHQLLKNCFPDQNIAFFTGNGELLGNFEKYCNEIPIEKPQNTFRKNSEEEYTKLRTWLTQKSQDTYLTLRRGIIEGCRFVKEELAAMPLADLEERLLFYKTTSLNIRVNLVVYRDYVDDYLTKLECFFPLHPQNKRQLYSSFIKELAAEWEISSGKLPQKEQDLYKRGLEEHFNMMCQHQMKHLRNWSVHRLLATDISEKEVAYFFMLAMRAWIDLPLQDSDNASQGAYSYERTLANLFTSVLDKNFQNRLKNDLLQYLRSSYRELRIQLKQLQKSPFGNTFNDLVRCLGEAATPKKISNQRAEDLKQEIRQKWSKRLFYQNFWHGLRPADLKIADVDNDRRGVAMYINFVPTSIPEGTFPYFLGRLIFNEAF